MRLAKPLWRGRWTAHVAIVNPETSHCLFGAFWKRWRAISTVTGSWAVPISVLTISETLGKVYSSGVMGSSIPSQQQSVLLAAVKEKPKSHTSLSPTVNKDCCDGRQNAHNYCNWCERHMLSICNREPRHQSPSIIHKARRNCEFCLLPHVEPQDRAMPQQEFQKSTAQHVKQVLGKVDELKGHASGQQLLPKRSQTTPLTKLSRHMRKQLFFPPPYSPPTHTHTFPHNSRSSQLRKSKSGDLYPDRCRRPTHTLQFSAMVTTVLHSDWDRHASSTLATVNCVVPQI